VTGQGWPYERYGPAPTPAAQYGHAGQHHGTGAPGCPVDLHHHHDEHCERPEAVERWLAAWQAFADVTPIPAKGDIVPGAAVLREATEAAIKSAVRVEITPAILSAAKPTVPWLTEKDRLAATFRAAGFEVAP